MAAAVAPGLPPRRSLRGVLIASAGCFLALALAVGFTSSLPGDTAVREALLALSSPPVLAAMRLINRAGSRQLLLPGPPLLLLAFRRGLGGAGQASGLERGQGVGLGRWPSAASR